MATTTKQLCVTGPRRDFNFVTTERSLKEAIVKAYMNGFMRFACGMALGVDTVFADTVLALRDSALDGEVFSDLTLVAYVPFEGQELKWPQPHQLKYTEILREADVVYTGTPGYSDEKYILRNKRMIDESETVVAVYDDRGGGTGQCYDYSLGVGRYVYRIDPFSGKARWVKA